MAAPSTRAQTWVICAYRPACMASPAVGGDPGPHYLRL